MLFKGLLLKIEAGQKLTEKQEEKLAVKMLLIPSLTRSMLKILFFFGAVTFLLFALLGGKGFLSPVWSYLIMGVFLALFVLAFIFPKRLRIKKYLQAVDKFYQTKFAELDNFDLYYIAQHVNPHIRSLSKNKIYLLTDGYQFLLIDDYFKDTTYLMPKYISPNKEDIYLRVIDEKISEQAKMMIRLEDIEHYFLMGEPKPALKEPTKNKYYNYYSTFFDQNIRMDDKNMVVLKMHGGVTLRLSADVYQVFKKYMPLKERK